MINETTHFISYYHEEETAIAEQFNTLLEDRYEEIQKAFQFNAATQKYIFRLCGSVEEYIVATGKTKEEYQDWMVGHSNADTHTICLLSPNASEEAANQDMEKVVVHELIHMMFDDATGVAEDDAEVWLAEGIAVLYADQTELQYVSATDYPRLAELVGFDNFVDNGGYDYAGIYVWYFIKKFGFDKFLEVYREECEWQGMIYDGFEAEAIREFSMVKFVHEVFELHGENTEQERLSGGWTNHVFAAGNLVLRFTSNLESGRLLREAKLAKLLPKQAGYPEIVDNGRTERYDWMLCRRISGTNLEDVWGNMSWKERADALEQLWQKTKFVHTVNVKKAEAYVNKALWYMSGIENAVTETERLFERKLINAEQCDVLKGYIYRFETAIRKADFILVHGDLTPANAMWQDGEITALMDFECATIAPKEADLMMLLNTAYERMDLPGAMHDLEAEQQFHNRMRELVQKEAPDWDILQGYRVIKLVHHVVMDMNDEDFSPGHEELVCLLALLKDGKGKLVSVML